MEEQASRHHFFDWHEADNGYILHEVAEDGTDLIMVYDSEENGVHKLYDHMANELFELIRQESNQRLSNSFRVTVELKPIDNI